MPVYFHEDDPLKTKSRSVEIFIVFKSGLCKSNRASSVGYLHGSRIKTVVILKTVTFEKGKKNKRTVKIVSYATQ